MNFDSFKTYLISDGSLTPENFQNKNDEIFELYESADSAGVDLFQIREKQLSAGLLFALAKGIAEIRRKSNIRLLVNDRFDVALAAGADGVHLTSNSLRAEIVRKAVPADFIIGASTHNEVEIEDAVSGNADFVTFSPVFETPKKLLYGPPQGIERLAAMVNKFPQIPVIALGGISQETVPMIVASGAAGVAAIQMFSVSAELETVVSNIRQAVNAMNR